MLLRIQRDIFKMQRKNEVERGGWEGEGLGMKPQDKGLRIQLALLMKGVTDGDSDKLNAQSYVGSMERV